MTSDSVTRRLGRHQHAFTLVEILVTLAVTGILAAITISSVLSSVRSASYRAQCASNMRQIGIGLLTYAADHGGALPNTTHTTGRGRIEQSWIYQLDLYLNVESVRVCPAEEDTRRQQIIARKGTSYLLNDLVFDDFHQPGNGHRPRNNIHNIPLPGQTLMAVIGARPISVTWDHAHAGNWTSWGAMLEDVAVDRHGRRAGQPRRSTEPIDMEGSANYLYADGRVDNIVASDWKGLFDQGINPGVIPR